MREWESPAAAALAAISVEPIDFPSFERAPLAGDPRPSLDVLRHRSMNDAAGHNSTRE
jgi:hypothetical protein